MKYNRQLGPHIHREETWDRPDVQNMYLEAIKWALGMTNADVTPHPMPTATR